MAETGGVSESGRSDRSSEASRADESRATESDRADVSRAADEVGAADVAREAESVRDATPEDGLDPAEAAGGQEARDREAAAEARAAEVAAGEVAAAAAEAEAVEARTAAEVAAGEAAAASAVEAAPEPVENPAALLADETLTQQQMEARLAEMSPVEVRDVVTGLDQPDMEYGARMTEQGWAALEADIDRRYEEAARQGDWTNPELAELSVEVTRNSDRLGSYAEKSWRDVATTMTAMDPEMRPAHESLRQANRLADHYVSGGRPPPAEMSNRQLLDSVREIPGMRTFGDVMSLTGVGMLASFAAEGGARERLAELDARIADGRMSPVDVDRVTHSDAARVAGTAVLAAEVAAAASPRGWVRDGATWVARRARDLLGVGGRRFGDLRADELLGAADRLDRSGRTFAGRALEKHGSRPGSAFPTARGNPDAINAQGRQVVQDILEDPGSVAQTRHHARFGDVVEVRAPDGRGVRYGADGSFLGFLEP